MSEKSLFGLDEKIILVTGSSSGIGKEIAILCSKMGASLIITGRNAGRLEETKKECSSNKVTIISADLVSEQSIEELVAKLPVLDGVVHCAGVCNTTLCKQIKQSDVETMFNINFIGPVILQASLLRNKKLAKGSSIVFMASRAAESPAIGNALYSASKGAIISYSKCLGLELAPRKIRVNCVAPAMVWTDLIITVGMDKVYHEEAEKKYPLGRYGKTEDIAPLVIYLLSDESSWMTGSVIDITGGGEGTLTK